MKRFFILTALMAVLGLSSCEKEPSKAIIGTWEAETIELIANGITTSANLEEKDAIMRFTFNADGTGSAEHKEKALKEAGVSCAESTQHIVEILLQLKKEGKI